MRAISYYEKDMETTPDHNPPWQIDPILIRNGRAIKKKIFDFWKKKKKRKSTKIHKRKK